LTIVGRLAKAIGLGGYKVVVTQSAGPSSYSTGGFSVTISELSTVDYAVAQAMNPGTAGYLAVVKSVSDNTVTVQVYEVNQAVDEGGTATYTVTIKEVGAGTDLSGINFTVIAFGS